MNGFWCFIIFLLFCMVFSWIVRSCNNCSHRYSQGHRWNQEALQETHQTDSLAEEDEEIREVRHGKIFWHSLSGKYFRWNRSMRRKCRNICKSQWMFWLIVTLVFLNTCVLATEHHHQPEWLDDFQVSWNRDVSNRILDFSNLTIWLWAGMDISSTSEAKQSIYDNAMSSCSYSIIGCIITW